MNVTVDASVFVAQAKEGEPFAAANRESILRLEQPPWQVVCPSLVLPECAGALAWALDEPALSEALVELVRQFPGMALAPLTIPYPGEFGAGTETVALSANPEFLALIERSRRRQKAQGGISSAEMRRRLGETDIVKRPTRA
jgi:hypothetical protein